ncbi:MAG: glycosyltransferase [Bifidobacteriaceae bacterium]|jgi:hypothetical protein|nr:glycosyltransferase [Bifidobacteriaceae bacterium]
MPKATAAGGGVWRPLLSVIVPAYNAAPYLGRCLASVAGFGPALEVVVVDDGSDDSTAELAEAAARAQPGLRVLRQPNKGHGGAINTGLAAVTGLYTKVLDADDWFDRQALSSLLAVLAGLAEATPSVDVVVTNFVYNNVARSRPRPVRYTRALPAGGPITWRDVRRFRPREYLMMHSLAYRTELLRGCGLALPEHTFYVDCIFAFAPLFHARSLYYLDVDLYQYLIGRPGQSVNESVMLERIDQQVAVARQMLDQMRDQMRSPLALEPGQRAYLLHYLDLVCTVTSSLLLRSGEAGCLARRRAFWRDVRDLSPALHRRLRWSLLGTMINLPGAFGRRTSLAGYRLARRVVGFS